MLDQRVCVCVCFWNIWLGVGTGTRTWNTKTVRVHLGILITSRDFKQYILMMLLHNSIMFMLDGVKYYAPPFYKPFYVSIVLFWRIIGTIFWDHLESYLYGLRKTALIFLRKKGNYFYFGSWFYRNLLYIWWNTGDNQLKIALKGQQLLPICWFIAKSTLGVTLLKRYWMSLQGFFLSTKKVLSLICLQPVCAKFDCFAKILRNQEYPLNKNQTGTFIRSRIPHCQIKIR